MNKVFSIRGTNGSGKTYTARKVMEACESGFKVNTEMSNGVKVSVYEQFVIIGSYARVCGGCDSVKTPQLVWDAVVEAAEHKNVIYEGVIVGNVWEPTVTLVERLKLIPAEFIPICLNTDFDQAVANMNKRRADAGKEPLEDNTNIMTNHKKNLSSARKLHAGGYNPRWVSSEEAVEIILRELANA